MAAANMVITQELFNLYRAPATTVSFDNHTDWYWLSLNGPNFNNISVPSGSAGVGIWICPINGNDVTTAIYWYNGTTPMAVNIPHYNLYNAQGSFAGWVLPLNNSVWNGKLDYCNVKMLYVRASQVQTAEAFPTKIVAYKLKEDTSSGSTTGTTEYTATITFTLDVDLGEGLEQESTQLQGKRCIFGTNNGSDFNAAIDDEYIKQRNKPWIEEIFVGGWTNENANGENDRAFLVGHAQNSRVVWEGYSSSPPQGLPIVVLSKPSASSCGYTIVGMPYVDRDLLEGLESTKVLTSIPITFKYTKN